jgi:hypothetical protein
MPMSELRKQTDLSAWLHDLDALPLECDGIARTASKLLEREGVEHTVHIGKVVIEGVGTICPHFWIELPDGRLLDLRARMWLREHETVPHGVFVPQPHQHYTSEGVLEVGNEHPIVFFALAGKPLDEFPMGLREALGIEAPKTRRGRAP